VQISFYNFEEEIRNLKHQLEIAQKNFKTAETSRGKITYRERIVTLTADLETARENLTDTQQRFLNSLKALKNLEAYYTTSYSEVINSGKTGVFLSIFPGPKSLVLDTEMKYFTVESNDN